MGQGKHSPCAKLKKKRTEYTGIIGERGSFGKGSRIDREAVVIYSPLIVSHGQMQNSMLQIRQPVSLLNL